MKVKYNDFLHYRLNENLNQVRKYLKSINREMVEDEAGFSAIKDTLKNSPNYLLPAVKFYNGGVPKDKIIQLFNKMKQYKQLLKNKNVDILTYFKEIEENAHEEVELNYKMAFEYFSDMIEKEVIDNEDMKYVKKFISNKYKHLIDSDTVKLINKIKEIIGSSDHKKMQSLITSKLAAYKTPEEFNKALQGIISQLDSGALLKKIKENNIEIIHQDESVIIVNVKTYKQICAIGTQKWCIVRDEYYFDDYVEFPRMQYIIFDLTKESIDPLYMLGVTVNHDGSIHAAHDMEDYELEKEEYIKWKEYLKPMPREEIEKNIETIIQAIDFDSPKKFEELLNREDSDYRTNRDPYQLFVLALQKDAFNVIEYIMDNMEVGNRAHKLIRRVFSIRAIVKENFDIFKKSLKNYYRLGHKVGFDEINTMLFNIKKEKTSEPEKYIKHILDNYDLDYTEKHHNNATHVVSKALHTKEFELFKSLFNDEGIKALINENDKDFFQKQIEEHEEAK